MENLRKKIQGGAGLFSDVDALVIMKKTDKPYLRNL